MQVQAMVATPSLPASLITDPNFIYTPANKTDVTRTFRRHGWTEPDRAKQREMKRLLNQSEDDLELMAA